MLHYSARQRNDGRWDYTCSGRPVGYCCPYSPIPEDGSIPSAEKWNEKIAPLRDKFHTLGHATEDEAQDCYKQYLLDTSLTLKTTEPENANQQNRCRVCKKFTACLAMVGAYSMFVLCPEHQTREVVAGLLVVGESWES